jgi:phosphoglucomutase
MNREQELYELWSRKTGDNAAYAAELAAIRENPGEIRDRFYRGLDFGTAGLRGVLGLGTNRMNIFTVRQATQGFSRFLLETRRQPSVAIAYDSRNFSREFAEEAAAVFAANGIRVRLYRELMPTPALSYAVRELACDAGVVVTASHNPAKYNGYKAYGSDGCQIGPEQAASVMGFIEACDLFDGVKTMPLEQALESGLCSYIPEEFVQRYISRVLEEALQPEVCAKAGLKLVYTPLNGAGNRCVRTVLEKAGLRDLTVVPEQEFPDGNFPTCPYPNPEIKEALALGLKLCEETAADLLLATDPDSDRVAVAVRAGGGYQLLTGNEVGVLLLDYIARTRLQKGTMPKNPVTVKSIVSTKLADAVAAEYGVEMVSVLTGFKFIGEVILGLEEKGEENRFIFGFEESCGYLSGGFVRDKDAVNASLLLVEMASALKLEGKTLADSLNDIYRRHGIYRNAVESYAFEGADGMAQMAAIMENLRGNPPEKLAGHSVTARSDYKTSKRVEGGVESALALPPSNVLEYELDDKCSLIVRPSGTEPKIKLYYSLVAGDTAAIDRLYREYGAAARALIGV